MGQASTKRSGFVPKRARTKISRRRIGSATNGSRSGIEFRDGLEGSEWDVMFLSSWAQTSPRPRTLALQLNWRNASSMRCC